MRLCILFLGPADEDMEWTEEAAEGMARFVRRLWRVVHEVTASASLGEPTGGPGKGFCRNVSGLPAFTLPSAWGNAVRTPVTATAERRPSATAATASGPSQSPRPQHETHRMTATAALAVRRSSPPLECPYADASRDIMWDGRWLSGRPRLNSRSYSRRLLDDLGGLEQHVLGDGEAEGLGGLQVYGEVEFARLLDTTRL